MDIGTAKPTRDELARVPHHMIDICDVDVAYNIVAFDEVSRQVVDDITKRGKSVVVTGGSGFYLKSFLAPVIDTVVVPDAVRGEVAALFDAEGLEGLLHELNERSSSGLGNLDIKNPRRVLRALERCIASGKPLLELQEDFANRPEPYPGFKKHLILLERDSENLRARVAKRAELMLAAGFVDEVRKLIERGIERNPSAASAIGYRETLSFLHGEIEKNELLPAIIQGTMHLVKKQRTWFRTQIREPDERIQF